MALVLMSTAAAALLTSAASARVAAVQVSQPMTFYSIPTREQYLNHSDDRARGKGNNPFGNFTQTTTGTRESANGPFAGDRAIFSFKLFKSADLSAVIGSATFTCQYSFNQNAFCNAVYFLNGGSLIASGEFSFNAKTFVIAVTRGTGNYRSKTGSLEASPSAKHAQRLVFTPGAAKGPRRLTVYSIATQEEFNNHKDDRARGKGNNPFGNFSQSTSATKEGTNGPFAGDRAIFTLKLFDGADLSASVGSATFLCQYSFAKVALCNVNYVLSGGTLIAAGQLDFNAKTFAIAITGGTGKYRGRTGDVEASPSVKGAQRLAVTLD
jgi:hypothetical protein